ncbi:tetratricopeptide repeat-containing diguanylate cyclase [Deinococcus sedimenti]|uniref:GGDEF domain-containing protein n=1 Tax=Deinococcus sedimenti TaxID=1867090 RepID=A0ABQ2S5R6_9DEIO|nr:tetratricopeptide repeat-containing diguanylate cyclase [Deinococcus sedimenti]GGR88577.1 hypothetical protein GCM10008960_14510 [Deinococcus sedimenti]
MSHTPEQLERDLRRARGRARLRPLLALAAELWDKNPVEAVAYAQQAAQLARRVQDPAALARATLELGRGQLRLGQYAAARAALHDAVTLHEQLGDDLGLARSWMGLGTVRSNLGELPQALEAHFSAQILFERQGSDWYLSACLNNLGVAYQRLDDNVTAMNYALSALRLATGAGNTVVRIAATNNVGNVAMELHRYEDALSYQTEALHLARVHGSPYNEIVALTNLGNLHGRMEQFSAALPYLARADDLARAYSDLDNLVEVQAERGNIHRRSGELADALAAYAHALELVDRMGDFYLEAQLQLRRGQTLLALQDHEAARGALNRALTLAARVQADAISSETHEHLTALHEQTGDLRGALHHLREHLRLTVAVNRAAAERSSAVRVIEHETERSRQVAAAQRHLIEQLHQASAALTHPPGSAAALQGHLTRQANLDPLTGLVNDRFARQQLQAEFEQARAQHHPLAVATLDLEGRATADRAPMTRDTMDRATADRVRRDVSAALRAALRTQDVLASLDDGTFALLLPRTDLPGALHLCRRLQRTVTDTRWPDLPGTHLTLSVGLCTDTACAHPDDMLDRAQHLLYAAKAAGSGQVCTDQDPPGPAR